MDAVSGIGRRRWVGSLCAAVLVVGLLPAAAVAQVQWKMTTEYPESNISGIGLVTFGKLLSSKTQGSLTTATAFDNELKISARDMPQAAQDHRVDGGDAFAAPLESSDPIFGLSALPFVVQSVETAKAVNAKARPLYERALAAQGMKLLYVTIWPATGIWSDQPLKGEEDLHALAVRAYDKSSADVLRAAGAAAEFLGFNEAIAKVREHKLNAILTSGDGGAGRRLWDDLRHFTPINYAIPVSIAFIRKDAFDGLPADQQAAVDAAAAETENSQIELLVNRTAENYARMRANGVSIDEPAPPAIIAALKKAGSGPIAAWQAKASPEAAAILDWANTQ
ncbi:TRAP-type C4-dicarboxylate transport system, substrate-binding protein [Afipia sp. GAS231]|nr:TRAP-type C4-dicarboxylate transport system, substrate-binding protein [Afipia sp. GAS231]